MARRTSPLAAFLGLFAALPAAAVPDDPRVQLGTYADGGLILAGHLHEGRKAFAGAIFDLNADLREAGLDGADLRGADLAGADLTGADLTKADLVKADLRHARLGRSRLQEAKLAGADLRGARLDPRALETARLADTLGPDGTVLAPGQAPAEPGAVAAERAWAAQEPDPGQVPERYRAAAGPAASDESLTIDTSSTRADLRGFFQRGRPVGSVAQVGLPDFCEGISRLVSLGDGVAWVMQGNPRLCLLRQEGFRAFNALQPLRDLGLDGARLWFTTEAGGLRLVEVDALRRKACRRVAVGSGMDLDEDILENLDGDALVVHKERVWLPGPGADLLTGYALPDATGSGTFGPKVLAVSMEGLGGRLVNLRPSPTGDLLYRTEHGLGYLDAVGCMRAKGGKLVQVRSRFTVRTAVQTRDRQIWVIDQSDQALVGRMNVPGQRFLRGPFLKPRLRVGDLVEGPGGSIWFTEPGNDSLCRVLPGDRIERFRLPQAGLEPTLLTNGGNGLIYFVMAGGRRLGSIVADADGLDRPPARAAAASAGPAAARAAAQENPARPDLVPADTAGEPRKEAVVPAPLPAAAATAPVVPPTPSAASSPATSPASSPTPSPKPSPTPSSAPAAPAPAAPPIQAQTPRAWLEANGITVDLSHIEARHFWNAGGEEDESGRQVPGQFTLGNSTWPRIEGLVAVALAYRDDHLEWNADGTQSVFHHFARPVGFYLDRRTGDWAVSRLLRVVLDGRGRQVLSAFPVKPFGRFQP